MAKNIILDAFAGYNTATAGIFWNLIAPTISPAAGRVGPGATSQGQRSFALEPTACVGLAYKRNNGNTPIVSFINSRTKLVVSLCTTGDGRVFIYYTYQTFGGAPTEGVSSPVFFTMGEWFYYELKCTHHQVSVDGILHSRVTYEVRVNEGPLISGYVQQRLLPVEYGFSGISVETNPDSQYCDLYVTDGEYLGDIKNYIIRPDGDSVPSQWTPSAAGAHYLMVNDLAPDGATTTLDTSSAGDQDMVTLEDIAATGLIRGIQCNFVGQKTDAGVSSFRSEYNIGGSGYENSADKFLSYQAFLNFPDCFRKNPVTGLDFTVPEINGMTIGVKRTA